MGTSRGRAARSSSGVGMARPAEQRRGGGLLDDAPGIHHHHLVAHLGNHAEIVGDEQQGHAQLALEAAQEIQDLGLDGDVEGGGRLVGDEQARPADQGHGDHHALAQAPGKLMRILGEPALRRADADQAQHLHGLGPRTPSEAAMEAQYLLDLEPDGEHGIEARHGFLEHHAHTVAAKLTHGRGRQGQEIDALEQDSPAQHPRRRARQQAHDGHCRDALAAAGLAHQAQGFPGADGEARFLDHGARAGFQLEGDRQIVDGEERWRHWRDIGGSNSLFPRPLDGAGRGGSGWGEKRCYLTRTANADVRSRYAGARPAIPPP